MPAPKIIPRPFKLTFPEDTPRVWVTGRSFVTTVLNVYTLLVPDNELYYMRTLRKALPLIEDPELKQNVLAFFRQEGEHGLAHRRYWSNLRGQGYHIDGFVRAVSFMLYRAIEPLLSLRTNVAVVSTIEHFNAMLGHLFLSRQILKDATPCMRSLMHYHFAEEIEHKAVCLDVFTAIGGKPWHRVLVAIAVIPSLYLTFMLGTAWMLLQDRQLFRWSTYKDLGRHWFGGDHIAMGSLAMWGRYLSRRFHPDQVDDYTLAEKVFHEDPALQEKETTTRD